MSYHIISINLSVNQFKIIIKLKLLIIPLLLQPLYYHRLGDECTIEYARKFGKTFVQTSTQLRNSDHHFNCYMFWRPLTSFTAHKHQHSIKNTKQYRKTIEKELLTSKVTVDEDIHAFPSFNTSDLTGCYEEANIRNYNNTITNIYRQPPIHTWCIGKSKVSCIHQPVVLPHPNCATTATTPTIASTTVPNLFIVQLVMQPVMHHLILFSPPTIFSIPHIISTSYFILSDNIYFF
ncbi:hypothetical protein ACTA71_003810 [Dictyostelium dimigraforme]